MQLFFGKLAHHAAFADDAEARCHAVELVEHMARDNHGHAAFVVEAHEHAAQRAGFFRIDTVKRLVEE